MKRKTTVLALGVICALCLSITAFAADTAYEVEITNNVDKKDVVTVSGLEPKSAVSVYSEKGTLLGKKNVGSNAVSVSINVALPGSDAGTVTVSVLPKGAAVSVPIGNFEVFSGKPA